MGVCEMHRFTYSTWTLAPLIVLWSTACGTGETTNGAGGETDAPPTSAENDGTANVGEWWTRGPSPSEAPGSVTPSAASADMECNYPDPFTKLIGCRKACYFVLAEVTGLTSAPKGHVMEGVDGGYVVLDTIVASAKVLEHLTHPVHFEGAPFDELTETALLVQQYPTGYMDLYAAPEGAEAPAYSRTIWSTRFETPDHASLSGGRMIIGLRSADDVIEPGRMMVTLALRVTDNGLVDMTPFEGTLVQKENGWPFDTPIDIVSLDSARKWFDEMLPFSGIRCYPERVESEADAVWPPAE